jgi:4-diphosphocytidyl-2-C-methyl-D-erythritol kinase
MFSPFLEAAPAKVNLALHVLGRRRDGYHELDSMVAFADLADMLLFEPAAETSLSVRGPMAAGVPEGDDNLVLRAIAELGQRLPLPHMKITLSKNLPVAAGLGGGSADAAAALRGALRVAGGHLGEGELDAVALAVGADVPVCLRRRACRMQGKGDVLTPASDLPAAAVLVHPGASCSTADVFARLGLRPGEAHLDALDPHDPALWRNDLTDAATALLPVIAEMLAALGAIDSLGATRMSGSGATCFGLARDLEQAEAAALDLARRYPGWWVRAVQLI